MALIYTDTEFRIDGVIRGSARPGDAMTIRTAGGVADNVDVRIDGTTDLVRGETYLLFLEYVATPTRSGSEFAWAPVSLGQGVFHLSPDGTSYVNVLGETFRPATDE